LFTLGVATPMTSSDAGRRTRQSGTITTVNPELCQNALLNRLLLVLLISQPRVTGTFALHKYNVNLLQNYIQSNTYHLVFSSTNLLKHFQCIIECVINFSCKYIRCTYIHTFLRRNGHVISDTCRNFLIDTESSDPYRPCNNLTKLQ
jgi:hypothetical protein